MTRWLTPARWRGVELLDDPATPAAARARAMADIARSNALFGGRRSALRALRDVLPRLPSRFVLLDVGTGAGDVPVAITRAAARTGASAWRIGADVSESVLRQAGAPFDARVVVDARQLPFADASADVVLCSQLLHHFTDTDALRVVAELSRVARRWAVVSDLRRSWVAAIGFWLASVLLRFHPITRHDGVVSVLRGFTPREFRELVRAGAGTVPAVRGAPLFRLTAVWPNVSFPARAD